MSALQMGLQLSFPHYQVSPALPLARSRSPSLFSFVRLHLCRSLLQFVAPVVGPCCAQQSRSCFWLLRAIGRSLLSLQHCQRFSGLRFHKYGFSNSDLSWDLLRNKRTLRFHHAEPKDFLAVRVGLEKRGCTANRLALIILFFIVFLFEGSTMSTAFALSGSSISGDSRPLTGVYPLPRDLGSKFPRRISVYGPKSANAAGPRLIITSSSESVQTQAAHCNTKQVVVNVPHRSTKPRVILISGPTAVGKTRLSIELAKSLGGEIVNADSVQVYQGLDIGAAKATLEERQGVPHHVMDLVLPTVDYTTENFVVDARAATETILSKGLVPIVIGGTGLYMRSFMQNRREITSHRFEGECDIDDHQCDLDWDWDYDFQAYFLYQHRADLFPRVDIRCEQMIPALLEETSWLLNLGVRPRTNIASAAIGYEEAMDLLLEARAADGVVTEERFLEFLRLFMHNSKGLVKKQIAWFRKDARSDVRKFRWIRADQPVHEMVGKLVEEYRRPAWKVTEMAMGEDLKAASWQEQKRMKQYKPTIKIYSDPKLVANALEWIKATQGGNRWMMQATRKGTLIPANL